jgi:SAM-dependent methyltransferase
VIIKYYLEALRIRITNKVNTLLYAGNKCLCTLCDWNGKAFPEGICPSCKSFSRTRLLPYSLSYFAPKTSSILHIAPNTSEYSYIKKSLQYRTYDRLNLSKADHINVVGDITNFDKNDNKYSLIIAWHVLEHISDDSNAISEMYRVLKPDGSLLLCVPIFPSGNKKTFEDKNSDPSTYRNIYGHPDHVRSCGLDYYKRFENSGFKTETLSVKNLKDHDIEFFGLSKDHVVWLFRK